MYKARRKVGFLVSAISFIRQKSGSRAIASTAEKPRSSTMGTSKMPSPKRFLPEKGLGDSRQLHLFMRSAIGDVQSFGPQFSKEYNRLLAIKERLEKTTFRLAVVGAPGSGKSTLINALIGESILPTAMDSLVGKHIVVKYGDHAQAGIWSDGSSARFVMR